MISIRIRHLFLPLVLDLYHVSSSLFDNFLISYASTVWFNRAWRVYIRAPAVSLLEYHHLKVPDLKVLHFHRQQDRGPQLGALPNPYPVPGKPFNILFIESEEVSRTEIMGCLSRAYEKVMAFIDQGRGGEQITHLVPFTQDFLDMVFMLSRTHDQRLTYDDTKEILEAFWLKSRESGYRARVGFIKNNRDDMTLGRAELRRKAQSQGLEARASPSL